MRRSFETSDRHKGRGLQPIRVPIQRAGVFGRAREMVDDLRGWEVVSEDEARGVLVCRKRGGFLSGTSTITVTVEGPDGIPSSTVNVRSETEGGLLPRDRANVTEFTVPFYRRVC